MRTSKAHAYDKDSTEKGEQTMFGFSERVVIVTGAAGNLGRAVARAFRVARANGKRCPKRTMAAGQSLRPSPTSSFSWPPKQPVRCTVQLSLCTGKAEAALDGLHG